MATVQAFPRYSDMDSPGVPERLFSAAYNRENTCCVTASFSCGIFDLRHTWPGQETPVLDIPELEVLRREHLFLAGPSGCGKTTLLGFLAGIAAPREGLVSILGYPLSTMSPARRDAFRADHIGYIFQMFNLVPYLSVTDNVTLPLRFSKRRRQRATADGQTPAAEAARLLGCMGLDSDWLAERPVTNLSVGQQQRVAAARALIGSPELILADEPTSALDADNRNAFIDLLFNECEATGSALVFVSHDLSLAARFDRTYQLPSPVPDILSATPPSNISREANA